MRTLLIVAALLSIPAFIGAQTPPSAPACDGYVSIVRVSEIKAGGTVEGFMAAVAAHKAWYMAKGIHDEIFATRIIVRDENIGARSFSDKQFMTFHIHQSTQPGPKHDEGYEAFVKLYRDNSDIKSEYNVCMPYITLK